MRGMDETLTDYLDGRLEPAERAAFEARLAAEPALALRLRAVRAARAALSATAPAMPADLKASLKREARRRASAAGPRWLEAARSALWAAPWGLGLGAAFAAALFAAAAHLAAAPRGRLTEVASAAPSRHLDSAARLAEVSADLWSDDDGSDRGD